MRAPLHELLDELVELRRAQHARRDRARQHRLLVGDLRRAVAAGEAVAADDRHDDDPLHAGPLAGLLEVAGGGGEELRGRLLLGRGAGGRVDDGVRRRPAASASPSPVITSTPRERDIADDLVALGLEHVDDMTADPPGRARHCDLLGCAHVMLSVQSGAGAGHIGSISWVTALTPGDEGM